MSAYQEYNPGPTVAEQHATLDALFDALYAAAAPERSGAIGGSASLTWYLTGSGSTGGANPSVNLSWASTTLGHTATTNVRFDAALLGMLDPSWLWGTVDYLGNWVRSWDYSVVETWRTRLTTASAVNSVVSGLLTAGINILAGGGDTTGSGSTLIDYTDGSRSGKVAGFRLTGMYNPTAGELTAGIKRAFLVSVALVSGADDGTINAGGTGGSIGESVREVPVPIAGSADAQQSWLDWTKVQPFDKRNVSHIGDLGGGTPVSSEPDPGDGVPIFQDPGQVPAVAEDPSLWDLMTTVPTFIASFFIAAGKLAASAASAGLVAATTTAMVAIDLGRLALEGVQTGIEAVSAWDVDAIATNTGTIATNTSTVATNVATGATNLATINDTLAEVKTSIDGLTVDVDVGPVVTAIETLDSNHAGGLVNALATLDSDVTGGLATSNVQLASVATQTQAIGDRLNPATAGSFGRRLVEALESIADSLKASPGASPPAKKLVEQLASMQSSLDDVANLQQTLDVQAHGVRFKASTGWDIP